MNSKKRWISIISNFIILILACLPIAFAQQAELTITKLSGSQTNIAGFYRQDEGIAIETIAGIGPPLEVNGIQPDQVRLYIDGFRNLPFQTCTFLGGLQYRCLLTTSTSPAAGIHAYEIRLYSDAAKFSDTASPVLTKSQPLTADIIGSQPSELTITPTFTKDGKIQVRYTIIDRSLSFTPISSCSGIANIEFFLDSIDSTPFETVTGDGTCLMQGALTKTLPGLSNGQHTILVKAKDRFGQSGPLGVATFTMDNQPPSVTSDVTVINSDTGLPITFVRSPQVTFADISIKLTKANLTPANVRADFSKLATSPGQADRPADLIKDFIATWKRIAIFGLQSCTISVTATDNVGNRAETTASCAVQNDDIGPSVQSMETDVRDSAGNFFIGKKGVLTIRFSDQGSGLNSSTAFANLATLIGRTPVPANQCDASGSAFTCTWNISPTFTDGKKTITAHRATTDIIGNPLQQERSLDITQDTTLPSINKITFRTIEGPQASPGVPIQGTSIEFTLNGSGFDPAKVMANTSALGGSVSPMTCSEGSCTSTSTVSISGPLDAVISFFASDTAGNTARDNFKVSIAGIVNETPNFWISRPTCAPLVDRSTTSLIQHKVFCDAQLFSPNSNAKPVSITFSGASSCSGDISKFIAGIDAFNVRAGGTHPTFGLTLFAADYKVNQLQVTCPLEITTVVNSSGKLFVTLTPEIENVTMTVQFYNLPLSEMDKNIQQQIDSAVKDAKDNLKFIGQLNSFVEFASKICNLKVVFTNLMQGFNALKNLFGGASLATVPGSPTREALKKNYERFCHAEQGASQRHEDMFGFLDKLCLFVNCRSQADDSSGGGSLGFLAKIGGGTKQCKDIQARLESIGGASGLNVPDIQNKYTYLGGAGQSIDVKNSLIMSSLCLCVPGIIHNLNKLREIKCQYALCMQREVKDGGLPPSFCKNLQSYLYCNYIVGDVFSILPIFRLWDQTMNILKNIYANPLEALPVVIGLKCKKMCDSPEQLVAHNACIIPKTLAKIGDAIGSIKSVKNMKDFFTPGQSGFCDQLEKLTENKDTKKETKT